MNWYQVVLLLVTIVCIAAPILYVFGIKEKEMHPNVKEIQNVQALRIENAKLRELVKAFDWCTENFDLPCKCDSCPLGQSDKLTPECEVIMRELGVEVGDA